MIKSIHTLIYAHDADATRAFFRDTLKLPFVDAMDGWLIFALPPTELGIHPAEGEDGHSASGRHSLSLMCDDIAATVKELSGMGVEITKPVKDEGWGITSALRIPGSGEMMLYQPRHISPLKFGTDRPARKAGGPSKAPKKAAKKATKRAAKSALRKTSKKSSPRKSKRARR